MYLSLFYPGEVGGGSLCFLVKLPTVLYRMVSHISHAGCHDHDDIFLMFVSMKSKSKSPYSNDMFPGQHNDMCYYVY